MSKAKYPIAGPLISQEDISAVTNAASHDWYQNANQSLSKFEQAFAQHTNRQFAVTLPSCTSAIHLALAAMKIGHGNEVIVPNSTWIASSAPIHYVNATPQFVDVDPISWCIDVEKIEAMINNHTKAIIAVDLYGGMPNWQALSALAQKYNLYLIEDAAEAIGSRYQDQPAGKFGDCSVFSFHGSKTLTTGEGGMLVTDNQQLFEEILTLRDHGRKPGDTEFYNEQIGFKYKMTGMQAALGNSQLQRLDELVNKKREIFNCYHDCLSDITELQWNAEPPETFQSYWMTTIILPSQTVLTSKALRFRLKERGVDTRPFFYPLSEIPAYQTLIQQGKIKQVSTPVAKNLSQFGLNLPSALSLNDDDIQQISRIIREELEPILKQSKQA